MVRIRNCQKAVGKDFKGKISPALYIIAILSTFFNTWIAEALYVVVALMWLIPDQRIEHVVTEEELDSRVIKQDPFRDLRLENCLPPKPSSYQFIDGV